MESISGHGKDYIDFKCEDHTGGMTSEHFTSVKSFLIYTKGVKREIREDIIKKREKEKKSK